VILVAVSLARFDNHTAVSSDECVEEKQIICGRVARAPSPHIDSHKSPGYCPFLFAHNSVILCCGLSVMCLLMDRSYVLDWLDARIRSIPLDLYYFRGLYLI
jgi:hypothetical protein